MLLVCLGALARASDLSSIEHSVDSPDGALEAFKNPSYFDADVNGKVLGIGTKLFVRQKGSIKKTLLLENSRWMAAQWSDKGNLLVVEDHSDGHIFEVYVFAFKVDSSGLVTSQLVFHSPDDGYDVKWYFIRWSKDGSIILRKNTILHTRSLNGDVDFSRNLGGDTKFYKFTVPKS